MGTVENHRQRLRDAIEANAEALSAMRRAENMLARANEMLGALHAKRADFDSLDSEIATARAELIKQALENEDDAHLLTEEPSGFAAAKIARDNLDLKIAGVSDSIAVLQSELIEARKAAEVADYNLDCARAAVFAQVADEMAQEFHERLHELRLVSIELAAMANRPVKRNPSVVRSDGPFYGGGSSTIPMPPRVLDAIAQPILGDFDRKHPPSKKNAIAAEVAAWWSALRTDPNATLGEEAKEGLFPSNVRSDVSDAADVSLTEAAE